ncbi:unnamed protein product, partial [Iphiclides podalirius]
MIASPLFWEWFNIWLAQFLKDLYHEIKMVALRGNGYVSHGVQSEHYASTNNGIGNGNGGGGMGGGQRVPMHYMQQSSKHEPSRYGNCVPTNNNYRLLTQSPLASYPRASTPHRAECYHPSGAGGGGFMAGGAAAQQSLRAQPAPQPSAPPAPQQDMSKSSMGGHSYVSQQSQSPQARPQYPNFPYRAQHGTRPTTHPRQQQPYLGSAGSGSAGPVVYHHPTLLFQPHMGLPQSYPQPRSTTSGFYPYMTPYLGYSTPASHTPPSHAPPPPHMHPPMSGIRPTPTKRSHRVPIIDPATKQEVLSELYNNDNTYYVGVETNERQTPQPEPPTHSIAEEFSRLVNESIANEPPKHHHYGQKPCELIAHQPLLVQQPQSQPQPQPSAFAHAAGSGPPKADAPGANEAKAPSAAIEIVAPPPETPVVSAISDSPVIVPKIVAAAPKQQQKGAGEVVHATDAGRPSAAVYKHQQHAKPKGRTTAPQMEDFVAEGIAHIALAPAAPAPMEYAPPAEFTAPAPASALAPAPAPALAFAPGAAPVPAPAPVPVAAAAQMHHAYAHPSAMMNAFALAPQPQRIREPRERPRSEEKERRETREREAQMLERELASVKQNGPTPLVSSVDSIPEIINPATSQVNQAILTETKASIITKQSSSAPNPQVPAPETKVEIFNNKELTTFPETPLLTATELLSASIEKLAKESASITTSETKEASSAIEAQTKLTQSIARAHPEFKMKDINLNIQSTDPDTANGNVTEVSQTKTESVMEDINRNEKVIKNSKSNKKSNNKMANNETNSKETESNENGKDETDKVSNEQEQVLSKTDEAAEKVPLVEKPESTPAPAPAPAVYVPKYKYNDDQWSPMNRSGKKCYDIGLLMQIKEDPMSKTKPNAPLLEACNVIRTTPHQEPQPFNPISRPVNDSLFPNFAKNSGIATRSNVPRDQKKDGRNMASSSKGSVKLAPAPSGGSSHKNVIRVSLTREEVKLNQTKDAWKPTRLKNANISEEEFKTQELYKKFRGILNKLTPQKFDTLMEKVKTLEINNQSRLEGIIDLVFEKAIDEPNFSEAYANMCNKLTTIKVPANNAAPDQYVNFRALIISKCQNQFVTEKVDEDILKLEKEMNECTDPVKKKELQLLLEEENRKMRMRSVGNVRFIGELYKLKMLTSRIMVFCMNYLVEKLEEEKLECLCKLLTTIGEQLESEVREQLELVFKQMQEIVEKKSNKISSRVRFMIKDVIELRQRGWLVKSVVDSQPKMMDQIQKEAEQQQRHIELMNASPMGGYGRRDDGGRGKRGGDGRRQGNNFMDNNWKTSRPNYTVDMLKLKAGTQKNLSNIKLAPQHSVWNHGSGTKNPPQATSNSMISLTKNQYSMLENSSTDPTSLRGNQDLSSGYSKGASIERLRQRRPLGQQQRRRGAPLDVERARRPLAACAARRARAPPAPPPAAPAEPLPEPKKKSVKSMIDLSLINPDNDEVVADVRQLFPPQYHAAVITEIINVVLEKSAKEIAIVAKTVLHLVSTNTISAENFLAGMAEIFEFAPELFIDIPMLYDYLSKFITPQIEKKHITFIQTFRLCEKSVIPENHGHLFLKAVINDLKESMGPSFVKSKWQESGLRLQQWMNEEQVTKWVEDNKFEFLDGAKTSEETKKILTPAEVQSKLLELMNSDETCECVRGWVQDNVGASCEEEWFTRALMQAVCTHALVGGEGAWHLSRERMDKYARLLHELAAAQCTKRELSCLFAVQHLVHRLEHPQGLTLAIFQYLHEQYIISVEGFIAWETTDKEPEGKAVMLKALTSFFTNIREADNEDSCSEE